ncbi:TrlF family AAA-like ATPase [Pectinatus frisingensis]|uniref:TrlF family AAA-like ATPase n=1 Tax=Pectinatus frisingensis TaxID=865 RepID=UPI0018C52419|nr:hypothetical protein [Pectinatus frisingensis]
MSDKASYYKCALQVNSCSYAKFRGHTPTDEKEYNQMILDKCISNNISIVGLADHGSVDTSESLRKFLTDNRIVVFPGFEISTAEKIHIVCLFSPDLKSPELNRILGSLGLTMIEKGTEVSEKSCLEIALQIEKSNGFWYAAHITGDNGILKLGKNQHIWTNEKLIAAQIPDSRDNIDPNYANIIKNKDPQYKRKKEMAYINASDVEKADDLDADNTSVLIKMSEPNFENFKMSFKDAESRIRLNSEKENNYQSSIESVTITGGYLNGFNATLSENLATIIGGRGTGKSTLINIIRYALDKQPIGKESVNEFQGMIGTNLGSSSKVELVIISNEQHGQKFKITRRYNQEPVITNMDGEALSFKIEDILPSIEIYGQNEIMEIARDKSKIREVAERLFPLEKDIETKLGVAHKALVENGNSLSELESQDMQNTSRLDELPALRTRLQFYESAGIDKNLAVVKRLSTEEGQFDAIKQLFPIKGISIPEIIAEDYENEELKAIKRDIDIYNTEVKKIIEQYTLCLKKLSKSFSEHRKAWEEKKVEYDKQLKESLTAIEGIQDKSSQEIINDYSKLIKTVEASKPLEKRQESLKKKKNEAEEKRRTLIENYKKCCDDREIMLKKNLRRINNKKLRNIVRLSIQFHQNITPVIEKLCNIQGIGVKTISGISDYHDFDSFTFASDVREGTEHLKSKYALSTNIAGKIINGLSMKDLREIEEMELEDIVLIELNVSGKYKLLKDLSKGQQCTAILNLLLLDNKDPLIIDQPEDNLDNSFIAENLVKTLRENKIKRQYILATHNANIPVFGDAEQIITMEEENGAGRIADNGLGSIDAPIVKANVINILEGGKDAFQMREAKYGI